MLLLLSAGAPDTRRLGLHTLIAADSPAAGGNVATLTMAASRHAVCVDDGAAGGGEEEEEEGCWVSYGWRRGLRRLPPPIPSHRALARARTDLVISREEPGAHRVRARKVEDRLVLQLVERDGCATAPPPPMRRWSHPSTTQEYSGAPAAEAHEEERGLHPAVQAPPPTVSLPAVGSASPPSPTLKAQGCLEGAIRAAAPLRRMSMTVPRTVH